MKCAVSKRSKKQTHKQVRTGRAHQLTRKKQNKTMLPHASCTIRSEVYLQCAVFSPLQELNKTLHHPLSGNDFINRWVGLCMERK